MFAVFPGEAECAYIGGTDSDYYFASGREMSRVELSINEYHNSEVGEPPLEFTCRSSEVD